MFMSSMPDAFTQQHLSHFWSNSDMLVKNKNGFDDKDDFCFLWGSIKSFLANGMLPPPLDMADSWPINESVAEWQKDSCMKESANSSISLKFAIITQRLVQSKLSLSKQTWKGRF